MADAWTVALRFSQQHEIAQRTEEDDWFDPVVTEDSPLYIDPFLVFEDQDPFWSSCHHEVVSFFSLALDYVKRAQGNRSSRHWAKAVRLLTFPEPKEFALGLSMGHPVGSGTDLFFARGIADALEVFRRANIARVDYIETFVLFVEELGLDRISDIFCNITKAHFIRYTQKIVERHRIQAEAVPVRHSSWSKESGRWQDSHNVLLPESPAFNGGVLLTPERFLQDIPHVTRPGFWGWAENNVAQVLRDDLNYDLTENLTAAEKGQRARLLASQRPDLAFDYVHHAAGEDHKSYDTENDPELLVGWREAGMFAFAAQTNLATPPAPDDFCDWVGTLMERFRHAVEEQDLWRVLWNDSFTRPRKEKIVQAVASVLFSAHCQASGVDLSREVDIGRGPVDFKFSSGWQRRALAEIKFIRSTKFFSGAEKQLPQYLRSEQIECGYYVCVGFSDADFNDDRLRRVTDTCTSLSGQKGRRITHVFVDARPKESASRLRN